MRFKNLRPILLLTLSLLTLLDSNFLAIPHGPGNSTPLHWHYARVEPPETRNVSRERGTYPTLRAPRLAPLRHASRRHSDAPVVEARVAED